MGGCGPHAISTNIKRITLEGPQSPPPIYPARSSRKAARKVRFPAWPENLIETLSSEILRKVGEGRGVAHLEDRSDASSRPNSQPGETNRLQKPRPPEQSSRPRETLLLQSPSESPGTDAQPLGHLNDRVRRWPTREYGQGVLNSFGLSSLPEAFQGGRISL